MFRVDNVEIPVEGGPHSAVNELSIESIKVELACLYYLKLPAETRSKGENCWIL